MTESSQSLHRRRFVQLAALGAIPAGCLLRSARATSDDDDVSTALKSAFAQSVTSIRIGTVQSNSSPYCRGLAVDPFRDTFERKDLQKAVDGWLKWYEELIDRAAGDGCRLVVLTEDITDLSHVMTYLDDRSLFTDTVDWQTPRVAQRLGEAARRNSIYVVACYFARENGRIFNVADLFGPDGGLVGRYRKVHLPEYELWQVSAGDTFPAFETELGWIGMLICYDQMWPESASCCAMNGAQIICQPSAASLTDYHMKTRAVDNQVFFVSSTGRNSMIVSPKAEIIADAKQNSPEIVWADVEIDAATKPPDDHFWEHLYSGIKDHKERVLKFRRPDAYGPLVAREPALLRQYPDGGVANTPEEIERVYQIHKAMMIARIAGQPVPYHWNY
jgi:predicted amidohydrolase